MSIIPGTRVLLTKTQQHFLLATVVNSVGDHCIVALDNRPFDPTTFVKVPASLLVPVKYWLMQTTRTKYENIPLDEYNTDPHKYFLNKGSAKYDIAFIRACWCWANYKLFDFALHKYPEIKLLTTQKLYGLFQSKNNGILSVNIKIGVTMRKSFQTTVHEMVHQYQWEKDEEMGHGPSFFKWSEAVKDICGVPLNRQGDLADIDADFDKQDIHQEDKKPFYVLMMVTQGKYVAIGSYNLDILERTRDIYSIGTTTYLRKMTNPRVQGFLKFQTTFSKKVKGWKEVPTNLAELIIDTGLTIYSKQNLELQNA